MPSKTVKPKTKKKIPWQLSEGGQWWLKRCAKKAAQLLDITLYLESKYKHDNVWRE